MSVILYLTPSLEISLHHLAGQVTQARQEDPLLPAVILAPTATTIDALRQVLGDNMGVYSYQFFGLGKTILDRLGQSFHCLDESTLRRLVHHLLEQMRANGELTTFEPVWEKPGFIQTLLDWLREMKSQAITPAAYAAYASASGLPRDQQLSIFYERYEHFLRSRQCTDPDDLVWLALQALQEASGSFPNCSFFECGSQLFVVGFDQFNPVQEGLLAALTACFTQTSVYLSWDGQRPAGSLALSRLARTRQRLLEVLPGLVELLLADAVPGVLAAAVQPSSPVLRRVRDGLFEPPPAVTVEAATASAPAVPQPDALQALAAPSRETEVRLALRDVKRLLFSGVAPGEIALLAPQPSAYRRLVELVAEEYGVPVRLEQELRSNPAVQACLNLVSLPPDFPWRETMDALRSPYISQPWLSTEQVGLLDELTRQRPVLGGREQWLYALEPSAAWKETTEPDMELDLELEDGGAGSMRSIPGFDAQALDALRAGLAAFFDFLTPPASGTHWDYALWIQERLLGYQELVEMQAASPLQPGGEERPFSGLLRGLTQERFDFQIPESEGQSAAQQALQSTSLRLLVCAAQGRFASRDLPALSAVLQYLRVMVDAAGLVLAGEEEHTSWQAVQTELLNVVPALAVLPEYVQDGVTFARLEAGRQKPCDHVFILGLSEGEYPSPPPADPLYSPAERESHPLNLRVLHPADDASAWWLVLSNCRRRLVLLRPRLDENGAPWEPSPYWDAVLDVSGAREQEIPLAYLPSLEQAASPGELLVAMEIAHTASAPPALQPAWNAAIHAHRVIELRQDWEPAPSGAWGPALAFDGFLQAADLQYELLERFPAERSWSASRLNRYGMCPYGFFAQYVLQLEAKTDPVEGIDAMQRGSLLHEILERLHRQLARDGLSMQSELQSEVLERLEQVCDQVFRAAPERYGFRPTALWRHEQHELRRMLAALVAWECAEGSPFLPYQQELRFGLSGEAQPAVRLEDSQGAAFYLHGVIDRIDRDENLGRLRVLDYKSGSTRYSDKDIVEGRALQSALYALAVESLLGESVAQSAYLSIPKRELSGALSSDGSIAADPLAQEAVDRAAGFASQVRSGIFPSLPSSPVQGARGCSNFCDFINLCRVNRRTIARSRAALGGQPAETWQEAGE